MNKISVIGSGKFGSAISFALSKANDNLIKLYSRSKNIVESINQKHEHPDIQGVKFDLIATDDLKEALDDTNYIFIVTPSFTIKEVIQKIKEIRKDRDFDIIVCSKGLNDDKENIFISKMIKEEIKSDKIHMISGPSFASEIMQNVETNVDIGSINSQNTDKIINLFSDTNIQISKQDNINAMEIMSVFKNIMAIRIGMEERIIERVQNISDKKDLSYRNKIASLFVNLIQELKVLLESIGANSKEILNFSGIGDIMLTCSNAESRNYRFGGLIGDKIINHLEEKNKTNEEIQTIFRENKALQIEHFKIDPEKEFGFLAEGFFALKIINKYLASKKIELKTVDELYKVLD